jgi:hypothetical protein
MELALSSRFDPRVSRRMYGVAGSAVVHLALLLVIMFGGSRYGIVSGDTLTSELVLLEEMEVEQREGVDLPPLPAGSTEPSEVELEEAIAKLAPPPTEALADLAVEAAPINAIHEPATAPVVSVVPEAPVSTVTMPSSETAALSRRLEQLAAEALKSSRAEVTWEQDGRQYSALLIRERANEGTALERVTAEVTASDQGRRLTTLVNLNRLAFSQFSQIVDRWDPMVQLHDDQIVGRFHTNSRFNMLYDSRTAPRFVGKVTTTARSFNTESTGRPRDSDIFRGGIETGTGTIELPESAQPFEWAPRDEQARVHEFAGDTRIHFFADGSYRWTDLDTSQSHSLNEPSEEPVYFIATGDAALHVKGVVAGKVLVYSPRRIVIEGSLTCATDPRDDSDSEDYLGVVSDRVVEVAPPHVTGTLRIYGSLAAGSLSATEPRYATKIDYDPRFERQRPPGFPSTDRFEIGDWDGKWTEQPERAAGN